MTTQLTPHFTLEEFLRSDEATRGGLDNSPTREHLENLHLLACVMETARLVLRSPIRITSGYRSPKVNAAVGGTPTSAHALGWAADFSVPGMTAFQAAERLVGRVPYDQLILESSRKIVHLSADPRLRGQVMTQKLGPGTPFDQGLVL